MEGLLQAYKPVISSGIVNAIICATGNLLSQTVIHKHGPFNRTLLYGFTMLGLFILGPGIHLIGMATKSFVTPDDGLLKTMAIERLIVTPIFLIFILTSLPVFMGAALSTALRQTRMIYVSSLLENWKIWTPAHLINLTIMPIPYRPLFMTTFGFCWAIYISGKVGKALAVTKSKKQ